MHPAFAKRLGLVIQITNISAQKINSTTLETYGIVVAVIFETNQVNIVRFFKETFLIANVSPDVAFGMLFLILSCVDVDFRKKKLWWRSYTIEKAFSTIKRVELVGKKEFAVAAFDLRHKTFVGYIASLKNPSYTQESKVYPFCRVQIAALVANEALTSISTKFSDFADVFFSDLTSELLEYTGINNHAIKLVDDQQPPYGPIYNLGPIELETLKTYIETNMANGFIKSSKFSTGAPILFDKKLDGSFQLCIDYWGLNNLSIKNQSPLSLVGKSPDRLEQARRFI